MAREAAPGRRQQILDAAVKVFAREGFHATRVADIADEADVAYGLVYHYFSSKENVLNELFTQRWSLLIDAIEQTDQGPLSSRDKLAEVAGFIIDSYRYDPELMKVIIVEVTRAANTFGRTHLGQINDAYRRIARIVAEGQTRGDFREDIDPVFATMLFYGAIEQLLTGWIFGVMPTADENLDAARGLMVRTICEGLQPR